MQNKIKKSDKKRILKNSIIVTSATIIEKAVFFIINVIIARYLSIELYGEYTTALGYATFFSVFTNIGINQSLIRAINLESQYENEHFTNNLITKSVLALIIYFVLVISLMFTNYNSNTIHLTLIFGFVRIGNEYLLSFYALHDAKEKFNVQATVTSLFSLNLLVSTIIIILLKGNYFHFAYVRSILILLFLTGIIYHTFKNHSFKYDQDTLKNYIKNTIPFSFGIIFNNIISRLNLIILSLIHGTIYTGIYNNGSIFFQALLFIPHNFNRILLPYLYKLPFQKNKNKYQFTFDIFSKFTNFIAFILILNINCFGEEIIITVFGEKYTDSIIILRILSLTLPFMFSIVSTIIVSLDKQKIVTKNTGISAALAVVLNLLLINFYKSAGAATATLLTYISSFILQHHFLAKNKYININKMLFSLLLFSLITFCIYLLYSNYFQNIPLFFNFIIINSLFTGLTYVIIINKNDIRIVKDIFKK